MKLAQIWKAFLQKKMRKKVLILVIMIIIKGAISEFGKSPSLFYFLIMITVPSNFGGHRYIVC